MSTVDVILIGILAALVFATFAVLMIKPDLLRFYVESGLAKVGFEIRRSGQERPQSEIEPRRDD